MPAMHTVFPEETREETGYFLCLGLVTEPCQACTERSGDLDLTLQIHSAWGTGLWRTGHWVCREVWRGGGCWCHPTSGMQAAVMGFWFLTSSVERHSLLQRATASSSS